MAEYSVDFGVCAIIQGLTPNGEGYCFPKRRPRESIAVRTPSRKHVNAMASNGYPINVSLILLRVEWSARTIYPKGCRSVLSNRVNRNSSCSDPHRVGEARPNPLAMILAKRKAG
jgi:hypothetical protein